MCRTYLAVSLSHEAKDRHRDRRMYASRSAANSLRRISYSDRSRLVTLSWSRSIHADGGMYDSRSRVRRRPICVSPPSNIARYPRPLSTIPAGRIEGSSHTQAFQDAGTLDTADRGKSSKVNEIIARRLIVLAVLATALVARRRRNSRLLITCGRPVERNWHMRSPPFSFEPSRVAGISRT